MRHVKCPSVFAIIKKRRYKTANYIASANTDCTSNGKPVFAAHIHRAPFGNPFGAVSTS